MFETYDDIMSVPEVQEALGGIGKNAVYDLLNTNEIRGFRVNKRHWKVPKESVIMYIRKKANLL